MLFGAVLPGYVETYMDNFLLFMGCLARLTSPRTGVADDFPYSDLLCRPLPVIKHKS